MTVYAYGFSVSGGLTVGAGGLSVSSGGMTIVSNGVSVTGGASVNSNGLTVTGGASVNSNGLTVSGGITVFTGGIAATGGMSINFNGLAVTGGITLHDTGLQILGGGLTVTDGGVTIVAGGVRIAGGLSVQTAGMVITEGLTVYGSTFLSSAPIILSDRRLKENISRIGNALSKVSQIRGVYYTWRKNEDFDEPDSDRHVGVIAQEVREVLPEAVSPTHNGRYFGVAYDGLIPLLIEAIKELDSKDISPSVDEADRVTVEYLLEREKELNIVNGDLVKRVEDLEALVENMKKTGKCGA
jgi:hypothetical protein